MRTTLTSLQALRDKNEKIAVLTCYDASFAAFIITDMPFGTFQVSPQKTFENAARLMAAGAQMIKLEGGAVMAETISFLTGRGIPVCAHIGLTPQSVHQMGGYRVQGKNDADANRLLQDAVIVEQAGAGLVVLEAMPALLAAEITANVSIPTIGIGAGAACSGQVLVLHDMLDIYPGKKSRFVKNYMQGAQGIADGVKRYAIEVKSGAFPGVEHSF